MNIWTTTKFSNLLTKITKGTTPPKGNGFVQSGGVNYIKSDAVNYDGRIDESKFVQIDIHTHNKFKRSQLEEDDILFTMAGIFLGKSGIVTKSMLPANTNQANAILRFNKKLAEPKYIGYFLRQKNTIEYVNNMSGQSAQPNLNFQEISSIEINLPPLPEQKAIASVLSSLDDKIDLLHRQNETLEKMAETLFRKWFIEDAKEDWEYTSLEKYVTIYNGVSYKSIELNPSKTAMITLKSFSRNGGFRLDGFKEFTGRFKEQHVVNEGDLVVAHTDITQDAALIGNPVLVISRPEYETLLISMDLVKVESNVEWLSKEFLYFLMRTREFKEHCIGFSNGSTVLHLSKAAVPSFEFFLPSIELIKEFTTIVHPMILKMNKNISHIRNLERQRDNLLPKLMSGEVRVKMD